MGISPSSHNGKQGKTKRFSFSTYTKNILTKETCFGKRKFGKSNRDLKTFSFQTVT